MFENEDAGGNGTPDVALPTNAPAAPPIPVSPSGSTGAPRPAPQPAGNAPAPVLPTHENRPTHSFAESIRHALIGGTLGAMAKGVKAVAGPPPVDYSTDSSGKTVGTPRIDNTVSRLERIAQAALTGLASGAAMPPQKSRMAALAGGLGAGASAVRQQGQEQDLLKRKQAQENYDEQQRATLHKATVAMTNAQTHNLWQKIEDDENAKDTERQKNAGIVSSLNDYVAQNPGSKLAVQTLTEQQAMAMHESDNHSVAKHTFLPMGKTQAKDADGNPVFEADGVTPKFTKQFAAISGSADEKLPMPQGLADDVQKYSKFDPRLKGAAQIPAGGDMPLTAFLSAYKFLTEDKGKEADGWKNATAAKGKDGKTDLQLNPYTQETRPYPGGVKPLSVSKEEADIKLKGAEADKAEAEAAKAKKEAETEAMLNPPASSGLTGDAYLQTLQPGTQNVLKAIAEGRETRSPRQLQDKNGNPTPLAEALHKAYPDFDDKKAAAYGAVVKDFTSGNTSRALTAYGTAINHARALYDNTNMKSYIPGTDENKRYNQDVLYVATEVAKALNPTGVAAENAIKEQEEALRSYTNRKAAIENAEHILTGKMAETKQRWANAQVRPSYQPPMPNLSQEAMDNADYIRNHGKVSQPTKGQANAPAGASQEVYTADGKTLLGHVVNKKFVPLGQ